MTSHGWLNDDCGKVVHKLSSSCITEINSNSIEFSLSTQT